MKNFLVIIFALLFISKLIAMEERIDFDCLKPPVITYDRWVTELVVNSPIDTWGDIKCGPLVAWMRNIKNYPRITDVFGKQRENLPFLCLTPKPLIEKNEESIQLRADYIFPAPGADLTCAPVMSLYREVTLAELKVLEDFPSESPKALALRILQWQNDHYEMNVKSEWDDEGGQGQRGTYSKVYEFLAHCKINKAKTTFLLAGSVGGHFICRYSTGAVTYLTPVFDFGVCLALVTGGYLFYPEFLRIYRAYEGIHDFMLS